MGYVIAAAVVVAVAAFLWWRYTSVARGARAVEERLLGELAPLMKKLDAGEQMRPDEVAELAARPQLRGLLYEMLKYCEKLDFFPAQYRDVKSQAEAALAHWLMHPNELQDAPEQIELVEEITRSLPPDGGEGTFFVFRYKMAEGHWAAKDGWLLGLAGPFKGDVIPYTQNAAFSRCGDKYGEVQPFELVDWYVRMVTSKFERVAGSPPGDPEESP